MEATKSESISIVSFYSACVSLCKHDPTSVPNQGMNLSRGSALQTDPLVGICGLRVFATVLQVCARFAANSGTNKEHFSPKTC